MREGETDEKAREAGAGCLSGLKRTKGGTVARKRTKGGRGSGRGVEEREREAVGEGVGEGKGEWEQGRGGRRWRRGRLVGGSPGQRALSV